MAGRSCASMSRSGSSALTPDALHVFALLEAPEDDVEQRLHHRRGLPLGQSMGRHRVDEIILRQCRHLPSIGIDSRSRSALAPAPLALSEPECPIAISGARLGDKAGMALGLQI